MKGNMYFGLVLVCLLEVLVSVLAVDIPKYVTVGGPLSLRPPKASSDHIYNIVWKHNGDLVLEWVEGKVELQFYGTFKGRSTLDTTNGHLEVKHMTKDDSGFYSAEINNVVQTDRYDVRVIRAVPVPEVTTRPLTCGTGSDKDNCTLACNGFDSITDAEPITYSWKRDGQMLQDATANLIITNDEETRRVKTYSCLMKNPLGEKESKAHDNPFFEHPSGSQAGLIGSMIFLVLFVGLVIGLLVAWRKKLLPECVKGENKSKQKSESEKCMDNGPNKTQNNPSENVDLVATNTETE